MLQLIAQLERFPKWLSASLALLLVVLIAALYFATDALLAVSIFFVVPIAIAAWSSGRFAAVTIALISAGLLAIVDIDSGVILRNPDFTPVNEILRWLLFTLIALMLAALKETADHHRKTARVDDLTGIPNRRAFQEFAELEIARARRTGKPMTIAFTDIDNFKLINDSRGHQAGDRLLAQTAELMKKNIRAVDRVARFGGDEFVLLLSDTDSTSAEQVMKRLKADLNAMAVNNSWPVSFSTGVYTFARPPESVDDMISRADKLMYTVKQTGKNRLLYGQD